MKRLQKLRERLKELKELLLEAKELGFNEETRAIGLEISRVEREISELKRRIKILLKVQEAEKASEDARRKEAFWQKMKKAGVKDPASIFFEDWVDHRMDPPKKKKSSVKKSSVKKSSVKKSSVKKNRRRFYKSPTCSIRNLIQS